MLSRDVPEDGPRELPTRTNDGGVSHWEARSPVRPPENATRFVKGARTVGFLPVTEIQCPRGHKIKDGTIAMAQHTLRCKCGVLLYAIFTWQVGLLFLAEVDIQDIHVLKSHKTVVETMIYFGMPAFPARPNESAA